MDFFDLWFLAHQFDFEGALLGEALKETFAHRKTELALEPVVFTEAFWTDRQKNVQWRAFLAKTRLAHAPREMKEVVTTARAFLSPVVEACLRSEALKMTWRAPGPWRER